MKNFREWLQEDENIDEGLKKAALAAALLMGNATAKADAEKPRPDKERPAATQKENKPLVRVGDALLGTLVGLGAAAAAKARKK